MKKNFIFQLAGSWCARWTFWMNGVITLSVSCILDHPAPSWRCLWMRIMTPLLGSPRQCFCNVTHWRTVSGLNNFLSESVAFVSKGGCLKLETPCSPKASSDHLEPLPLYSAPTIILFITDILNIIHVDTILRTFCRPNQLHKLSQLIWSSSKWSNLYFIYETAKNRR